jgi:hypothetical protein
MTSPLGRVYVLGAALLVFLLLWAGIAAHPWVSAAADPRLAALDARQQRLNAQLVAAQNRQAAQWSSYRATVAQRQRQAATAAAVTPAVRIVQLPALATTRTS